MIVALFLSIMLWACVAVGTEQPSVSMLLVAQAADHAQILEKNIKEPFLLHNITFESDVYLSKAEFDYLVDLPVSTMITVDQIKKAISYLSKKNKFEKIILSILQAAKGYTIHVTLTGFWTLKKLKFHGGMIGKENYRHYYTMEPGDPFDTAKHEEALEKIRHAFRSEGYFNADVHSSVDYNSETKEVVVHCTLKKNERFKIDSASIEIKSDESMGQEARDLLCVDVQKKFIASVNHGYYSKSFINQQTQDLKCELAKMGYIYVTIELREQINKQAKKIDLVFSLDVHHKKEFVFSGNTFFSNDQLRNSILEFGHSAWLLPITVFAQEIEQMYQKKGFWQVAVGSTESPSRYSFAITERSRVSVKKVILKDATSNEMIGPAVGCFADFIALKYFDADALGVALDALLAWYLKEGYWDAHVLKQEFIPIDSDCYALQLTIDQGPRSYLTSLSIECFKELEHQGPFARVQKKDLHIPFDSGMLHEQRRWLLEYFRAQGYFHVDIKPYIVKDNGQVAVTWKINRGQSQNKFGKTVVVGSNKFPIEYILRELQYKEGQLWNQDALKQSFFKLKDLEVFEHINFSPDQVTKQEDEKAIILRLQEDEKYEVRLRGGVELQNFTQQFSVDGFTYRVGGAFIVKNPFNQGDQFSLDGDSARGYRELVAKYRLPWIFGQPFKTEFELFTNQYLQPGFIGSTKNIYQLSTHGCLVGFSRNLNYVDTGLNVGFEWMQTKIPDRSDKMQRFIDSVARAIDFDPRLLARQVPFLRVEPTVVVDVLDQKINPTKGSFTVVTLKGLFPLNRLNINTYVIKASLEQSVFAPFKSLVFALRFRCGHIFQDKFSSIMPSERFYLGGANSIRSYDTDFAPPLGVFCNDEGQQNFAPQGGRSMFNINAEVRFPIYKRLGGVLFQDLGALSNNRFADFQAKNILAGTGIGLRLATPVGPLRFDFAWKWTKPDPSCRSFAWFLTFGQAF